MAKRGNACQPVQAGSACQAHGDGFLLIAAMMAKQDTSLFTPGVCRKHLQSVMACPGLMPGCRFGMVDGQNFCGDAAATHLRLDSRRLTVRGFTQSMIDDKGLMGNIPGSGHPFSD